MLQILSFFSENPYFCFDVSGTFSQTCGPPLLSGVHKNPKEVWVCFAVFECKMGTMPLGYFLLVALYYCKINQNVSRFNDFFFLCLFSPILQKNPLDPLLKITAFGCNEHAPEA